MTTPEQRRTAFRQRYLDYLQTDHWEALRLDVFEKWGKVCINCGSNDQVDAHHLVYRQLLDCTPDDLLPLCRRCHDRYHYAKKNGTLDQSWIVKAPAGPDRIKRLKRALDATNWRPTRISDIQLNKVVLRPQPQQKPRWMPYGEYLRRTGGAQKQA